MAERKLPKRLYKDVSVISIDEGYGIALDGNVLKTPAATVLFTECLPLMEAIPMEWEEQKIEIRRSELSKQIDELHSRVTTNTKEIMAAAATQHAQQNKEIQKIRDDLVSRVGVLEKWRHVLLGGAIVIGFMLHKFINFSS